VGRGAECASLALGGWTPLVYLPSHRVRHCLMPPVGGSGIKKFHSFRKDRDLASPVFANAPAKIIAINRMLLEIGHFIFRRDQNLKL